MKSPSIAVALVLSAGAGVVTTSYALPPPLQPPTAAATLQLKQERAAEYRTCQRDARAYRGSIPDPTLTAVATACSRVAGHRS
jgi:hypothetical protein